MQCTAVELSVVLNIGVYFSVVEFSEVKCIPIQCTIGQRKVNWVNFVHITNKHVDQGTFCHINLETNSGKLWMFAV